MTDASTIKNAASLLRFLVTRLRAVPGEEEGVLHVAAVWRPPGLDRHVVLRIREETPRSELDFLILNLARARADAIVTTGRILRQEPALTHDLQGAGGVPNALDAWRRDELGLERPPWLLVLTSGRDLDPGHPAFRSWARPLVFCPFTRVEQVRRQFLGTRVAVSGHPSPSLRSALDHLEQERGARRISIEAGPSTAIAAYDAPARIDELLLSVFEAPEVPATIAGGELPSRRDLERILGPAVATFAAAEESGPWRFERYRRAILRGQGGGPAAGPAIPPRSEPRAGSAR
jgi:riboflavin biosynthesis pyrimidine reductase